MGTGQRSEVSVLGDATRPLVLHVVSALERKLLQAVLQCKEAVDSAATSTSFLSSDAFIQRVVLGMNLNCGHDSHHPGLKCCSGCREAAAVQLLPPVGSRK